MPEALKLVYNKSFINNLANIISQLSPKIDGKAFQSSVLAGDWKSLELKARMSRISLMLHQSFLGAGFSTYKQQIKLLLRLTKQLRNTEQRGFEYMFLPDYVEQFGLADFDTSTQALAEITDLASGEFAIRPFIIQDQTRSLALMALWSTNKSRHIRRLASEGCRPRLPWAMALPSLKKDSQPILAILDKLKDDSCLVVRRSVANNLNDIAKDNIQTVVDIAKNWYGDNDERDWLVKHACRTLLKSAQPEIMKLFGLAAAKHIDIKNFEADKNVEFGGRLNFSFTLEAKKPLGNLRIEFAIDHLKANGKHTRKVFKLAEADYQTKQKPVTRAHAIKPISTRRYYNGLHHLTILLNGHEVQRHSFKLDGVPK